MASRAVVPLQKPRGEVKKNAPAEGRTRRVLQDIGNLVVTNAQAAAEKNKVTSQNENFFELFRFLSDFQSPLFNGTEFFNFQKPITERVDAVAGNGVGVGKGRAATKLVVPQKNVIKKPIPGEVIVISSDEEDEGNCAGGRKSRGRGGSSKKENVRTFTSTLTARSKAACGLTNKPKDPVENIVDRFLSVKSVSRRELQLVGISSMLIASKYEEIWAPEVNDFVCISDNAYIREQILVKEKTILEKLEWLLTVPTPYVFLVRYIKASIPSDKEMENTVFFLAELGLMHYPAVTAYCPSNIAASAVYAARCTLGRIPFWTRTLEQHTGYSEDQLKDCAELLVSLHSAAAESKLKAVYRKFSCSERGAVALQIPAKGLPSKSLN
ncbi:hypothetical protein I3842_14G111400 [Carya illinoinensis]|uniref:B-like cyclin n=1 Tax=Carya illinoinensis TaxID=32201 RepID=A0A922DA81_CARIL|nr:hypothetical protein I3842_14G111400 [Carya illinoinensis]